MVQSTLQTVAGLAAAGSALVASFGVTDDLMDPKSRELAALTRTLAADVGEPQITWVAPREIEAVATAAGWPRVSIVDPASFAPWFAGRTDGLAPVFYEWRLVVEN